MVDQDKIIMMSKLAVLDKKRKKDLRITHYYPEDYIYLNNFITRLSILIIIGGMMAVHVLLKLEEEMIIPSNANELFTHYVIPYGSVILIVMILYSFISTMVYTKRYKAAERRVETYNELLEALEETDKKRS